MITLLYPVRYGGGDVPTYDFRCAKCGHEFSKKIPWEEKGQVTCPQCGSKELKEVFGFYGIFSKGSSSGGCTSFG